jgi:hypothetical protein
MRRYVKVVDEDSKDYAASFRKLWSYKEHLESNNPVGRCRLPVSKPELKALGFSA